MSTFERIDLSKFPKVTGTVAEAYTRAEALYAALRAAYAEIDRLRASALEWVTVTDDPATLPRAEEYVIVQCLGEMEAWPTMREPDRDSDDETWAEGEGWGVPIRPGDRWTYIPEVPHE